MEIRPEPLQSGDIVRIVSPASRPSRKDVARSVRMIESWGLKAEIGHSVFSEHGFLAGPDDARAGDLNAAIRDPNVRAIFAARGGKGSYRLVDTLDYPGLLRDPKFLVGFSDITALHFAVWKNCGMVSLHGALFAGPQGAVSPATENSLKSLLLSGQASDVIGCPPEPTFSLTTGGVAEGPLLGGNLAIMGTSAGWLLPDLSGAIVLIEAIDMGPGLVDRTLQMLCRSGAFDGVAGFALGQFIGMREKLPLSIVELLREHLAPLAVPIVGGLPIGHGCAPRTVPLGARARLDADQHRLVFPS